MTPTRYSCVFVRPIVCLWLLMSAAPVLGQTLAGGTNHSVILKSDGTVWTVGHNGVGQLGDGTYTARTSMVQVSGLTGIVAVASGANHAMALTSTGNLYVWGYNYSGQIGDGTNTTRPTAVQSSLSNVIAIAAGAAHSVALTSNGNVYTWGLNGNGQLGIGSTTDATSAQLMTTGAMAIAAGVNFTLVVKSNGTVWGAGQNHYGQLGDASTTQRTSPVQMSGISTAVTAAGGSCHSVILLSDGTLKAAGCNSDGELGDSTTTYRTSPVSVSSITGVTAIASGDFHTLALKSDGTVKAWGFNANGQLGDGTTTMRNAPVSVSGLSSISGIGTGQQHSLAVTSTGVVFTWGRNTYSPLGDGTTTNRSTPSAISEAGYEWKIGAPTLSVAPGTYNSDRTVTVTVATAGATIHYTQNGSDPTTSDSTIASGSSVTVTTSQTLKAKAFKTGWAASVTTAATYELKAAIVNFSLSPTTYTTPQTMTFTTATSGASIRYTTDGSTPTTSSTLYASPFSVNTTMTIKATAFKTGWTQSDLNYGTYTMNFGTLSAPTADNGTGTYTSTVTVALSAQSGATIRYTTDGSTPTTTSPVYGTALVFDLTTVLKAKAFQPDYTASSVSTFTETIEAAAPTLNPTAGTYVAGQLVTVSATTAGSTIRYTINGAEPTSSDPVIASGSSLTVGNYTLKAKAFKTGTNTSATTTGAYAITGDVTPPALGAGSYYSLAVRSDATAWGWGQNAAGQIGDGTSTNPRLLPRIATGLTGVVAIDGGGSHSHALINDGTIAGFGYNTNGQLGDGSTTGRLLPTAIAGVTGVVAVSDAFDHTVALTGAGAVYAWGSNADGQLGDGTTTQRTAPTVVTGVTSVSAIAAFRYYSLALKQDGTIRSWGRNDAGQLGNGTTTNSSSPATVSSITTATAIAAGQFHAMALLADGTVRAWGISNHGQVGDGTTTQRTSPVEVAGLADIVAIGAGAVSSFALKDDGTVWSWGDNSMGELGDGTTTDRSAPAQIAGLSDIVQIAVGDYHALAMRDDGTVYAWGRNYEGQLGDGTQTNQLSPIEISGPAMNWRVPTPTISVASGLYYANQTVTVSVPDPDAILRYTMTGVDPTSSDATVTSGATVTVAQSQTLKVSGWKTGALTSLVVSRAYELKAVTPTFTPATGSYGSSQSVSMSTTTSGATLRYTTDGTEPSTLSTSYGSAITVADTVTVKARAYKTGWTASDSGFASFWISSGTVATPAITPAGGVQASPPLVSITTSTSGATIRYTLDGSTPTPGSPAFVFPFVVNATTTVKAKAFKAGYTASGVVSTTFDVDAAGAAATPAIVPAGGWFTLQQTVTLSGPSGATLRYTTDGSDPTTSSTSITSGNTITVDKSQVVKVRAWASGVTPSAVRRADFAITGLVSAGTQHSMGVTASGVLYVWGSNVFFQIGSGLPALSPSLSPLQVLTNVISASAGDRHSLAAKADGSVWAWGDATNGRLGSGGASGNVYTPTQISFSNAVAVAAGYTHSLVLKSDGTVWAFGKNSYGEIGDGTTTQRSTAVQVAGLTGVIAIAAGRDTSYALQSDGALGGILWAWGNNQYGELGDGSTLPRSTPVRVTGIGNVTAISASNSGSFALALGSDGRVYGWGKNDKTQLGLGHTINQVSAAVLPAIQRARLATAGSVYGVAVDATARAWGWGYQSNAMAVGELALYERAAVPQRSDIGGVLGVVGAENHSLSIVPDGTVRGFGTNTAGQLGIGTSSGEFLEGVTAVGLLLADNTWLAGDQDQDGLPTWREYLAGTDPLNRDTNGNGILDGHDAAAGGDALDPDSDDDGMPNWIEKQNGTDPFNVDTDGDSVSDLNDAYPLDPARSMAPSSNPSDTTPPIVTLKEPVSARPIP